jgi:hypothetical protein
VAWRTAVSRSGFGANPPIGILPLVAPGKWLAEAGEIVEDAVVDGGLNLVFEDDLDRAVREGEAFECDGDVSPCIWNRKS